MNTYSRLSEERLSTCHSDLQRVFREVLKIVDHSIIWGHRGKADQDAAFASGASEKKWPDSKHNAEPSEAVDARPYPYDKKDFESMCLFAGVVLGVAKCLNIHIRWGGDWNKNYKTRDEKFRDYWHFELIESQKTTGGLS